MQRQRNDARPTVAVAARALHVTQRHARSSDGGFQSAVD